MFLQGLDDLSIQTLISSWEHVHCCHYCYNINHFYWDCNRRGFVFLFAVFIFRTNKNSFVILSCILQLQGPSKVSPESTWLWGPYKWSQSNFNSVHVFLYFGTFGLMVLQLNLASKLSELEQCENFAANNQFGKQKRVKMTPKSNWCHCQAVKMCLWVGWWFTGSKIEF